MGKKSGKSQTPGRKTIAVNRRARHEYSLVQSVEAGIVLKGCEAKSLRVNGATITQAFGRIVKDEVWIVGMEIPQLKAATSTTHHPSARRKLLLHRSQIRKLQAQLHSPGRTLVPLEIYFDERGLAKIELALAVGRRAHDKRQALAKRDAQKEIRRRIR